MGSVIATPNPPCVLSVSNKSVLAGSIIGVKAEPKFIATPSL